MDSIELKGLRFRANHGVLPQETLVGNDFEVDVRLDFDASRAMLDDDLHATLNYAALADIVSAEMAVTSKLIEHVAGRIRRSLISAFPAATGGRVSVAKLAPPVSRQMQAAVFSTEWSRS